MGCEISNYAGLLVFSQQGRGITWVLDGVPVLGSPHEFSGILVGFGDDLEKEGRGTSALCRWRRSFRLQDRVCATRRRACQVTANVGSNESGATVLFVILGGP